MAVEQAVQSQFDSSQDWVVFELAFDDISAIMRPLATQAVFTKLNFRTVVCVKVDWGYETFWKAFNSTNAKSPLKDL